MEPSNNQPGTNLKLEHKKQEVIPLRTFLKRVMRYALFSFTLILFSLCIGVIGYRYVAHLGWLDSFYMSCMILTGMGPIPNVTIEAPPAKIFSSIYALYSGIAFLSITAVFFTPIIHRLLHILQVEPDE